MISYLKTFFFVKKWIELFLNHPLLLALQGILCQITFSKVTKFSKKIITVNQNLKSAKICLLCFAGHTVQTFEHCWPMDGITSKVENRAKLSGNFFHSRWIDVLHCKSSLIMLLTHNSTSQYYDVWKNQFRKYKLKIHDLFSVDLKNSNPKK